MFNIHIHIGPADNDLLMLYKYLPYGLGKLFKNIILSYYKGEKYTLPTLKYTRDRKVSSVKVYFNKKEKEIIKPLFETRNVSSTIKNLTRMYFGKTLISICSPIFRGPQNNSNNLKTQKADDKSKGKINDTPKYEKPKYEKPKDYEKPVNTEDKKSSEEPRKMPNIFIPKEY